MNHEDDDDDLWYSGAVSSRDAGTPEFYGDLREKIRTFVHDIPISTGVAAPSAPSAKATPPSSWKSIVKLDGIHETALVELSSSKFLGNYLERTGKCFKTEVRDSGVHICGVHKEMWVHADAEVEEPVCPQVVALVRDYEDSIRQAVGDLLRRNALANSGKKRKTPLFDDYEDYDEYS